jgi:hypothetical protein
VRKSDLLELIRQINEISSDEKPIIVGSQAIHAITENLPEIAKKSIECDFLLVDGKTDIRTEINKNLGVFSDFQLEHGFYADALGLATVVLPTDWRKRLQPLLDENGDTVAYCAEIHDIAVSKLIAGRDKDFRFLLDAFWLEIISIEQLIDRIRVVELMPQNAVLIDRIEKLEKYLSEQKAESKVLSAIRDYLRDLKRRNLNTYYS